METARQVQIAGIEKTGHKDYNKYISLQEEMIMAMESYCIKNCTRKVWLHERWIEEYVRYAEDFPDIFYEDPDETHAHGKNSFFYLQLVAFLNKREHIMRNKLRKDDGPWFYEMKGQIKGNNQPSGITVRKGKEDIMYLRSDQFGFSTPKDSIENDCRYPYVKYMIESNSPDKYRHVADWIWNTRTVGGSFIWPIQHDEKNNRWQSHYNTSRGIRSYIQDRVDLTLFEVKHYYDYDKTNIEEYEHKDDVLFKEIKRNPNMSAWLNHFGSFEIFVEFFMFDHFVCKTEDGKMTPQNILTGKPLTEKNVEEIKSARGIIQNLPVDDIKNMLDNVKNWILERSKLIDKLLEDENAAETNA